MRAVLLFALAVAMAAPSAAAELPRRAPATAEPLPGIETRFGALHVPEGYRLRTITTRPAGTTRKLPAVYFVQWLSCDSIEIGAAQDGWTQMLRMLLRDSGMVVARTEKAGVGDSEGGPCTALDYETELAHHRKALAVLSADPWVDPKQVFIYGASMGANFAPLVAAGAKLRGIAVWGGGAQSWFERQLGFERRSLELGGTDGAQIDARMRSLSRLYAAYLLDDLTPDQVAARDAGLGAVWTSVSGADGDMQFGRPVAFHQQAQRRHWAQAWAALDVPVLALFGAFDWYESPAGVELIATVVNRAHPGRAEYRLIPGIDHHFMRYGTLRDSFADRGGKPDAAAVMSILLRWLKAHAG